MLRNIKLPKTGKVLRAEKVLQLIRLQLLVRQQGKKRFLSLENTCNVFLICFLVF